MDKVNTTIIKSECPLFACRSCRTKAGLPHQKWCDLSDTGISSCEDCRYWNKSNKRCIHPRRLKGGDIP